VNGRAYIAGSSARRLVDFVRSFAPGFQLSNHSLSPVPRRRRPRQRPAPSMRANAERRQRSSGARRHGPSAALAEAWLP